MKIIIIAIFGLVFACANATDTNMIYVTDDGFLVHERGGQIKLNPQKVEEAKRQKESLPANKYPEGNWGKAKSGFQLSIRFEKNLFTNQEPIIVTILLRNVTNQILNYPVINILGQDGPIDLTAIDGLGNKISPTPDDIAIISAHDEKLFPGTQKKFIEHLSQDYIGTNAAFSVYASLMVSCPHCVELKSASVPIKIE